MLQVTVETRVAALDNGLEVVFDRFYQEKSLRRTTGGTGLGSNLPPNCNGWGGQIWADQMARPRQSVSLHYSYCENNQRATVSFTPLTKEL